MKDLSLHILDIVQNSLTAGANLVQVHLVSDADMLTVTIEDNGCGMPPDLLAQVTDPFTTTRTTRRVGLGLPLWKMAAEQAEGSFSIVSREGEGTTVVASFRAGHIDTPPTGDMPGTWVTLLQGAPNVNFLYRECGPTHQFAFDTRALRETLEDVPLDNPDVLSWVEDYLRENSRLSDPSSGAPGS